LYPLCDTKGAGPHKSALGMAIPAGTTRPAPILTGKNRIEWVWVWVWVLPDLKNGVGAGNESLDTHPGPVPEPAPHIPNCVLPLLN
jgi:hypothetical protein